MSSQSVRSVLKPCVCCNKIELIHEVSEKLSVFVGGFIIGESGFVGALGIEVPSYNQHVV